MACVVVAAAACGDDEGDDSEAARTTGGGEVADAAGACAEAPAEARLTIVLAPDAPASDDELDETVRVLCERATALRMPAKVTTSGGEVVVQLEEADDRDRAVDLLAADGTVGFRPVLAVGPPDGSPPPGAAPVSPEPAPPEEPVTLADAEGVAYALGPALATGDLVEAAEAATQPALQSTLPAPGDTQAVDWTVELTLHPGAEGIDAFNEIAAGCAAMGDECPTGRLAIVVDTRVVSAPMISEPSFERDQIRVSGSFDEEQARDLAFTLSGGALPIPLEVREVTPG